MADEEKTSSNYQSPFDTIRHTDERMDEYWSARELHKILGYTEWRNFNNVVIKRAMKACEENGRAISEHFVRSYKMSTQEISWPYYPHVAEHPITRAFIEAQAKRQKRPKTVDAYARNLEDLMKAFSVSGVMDLVEAGPNDIENYVAWLFQRHPVRVRNKYTSLPTDGFSPNTIQQRIVTARLFYDFCICRTYQTISLG
jgi:Phage integrase, N-terminal SAM-like domain